jgi:hypothetical protein
MANAKITDLSDLTAQSGDEIPVNRAGSDGKVTAGEIAALFDASGLATTELDNLGTTAISAHLIPGSDAAIDLGTTTVGFNDLHLGSGGVVNFDGGDVTLTHSANTLTLAGGKVDLNGNYLTDVTATVESRFYMNMEPGAVLYVESDDGLGPILRFHHSSTTPADGDIPATIQVVGGEDSGVLGRIRMELDDGGTGSADSHWEHIVNIAGAEVDLLTIGDTNGSIGWGITNTGMLVPGADAAMDIGTSTVGINDLHLGSGGVVNFDGGDVTVTHSANTLTVAGGNVTISGADLTVGNDAFVTGSVRLGSGQPLFWLNRITLYSPAAAMLSFEGITSSFPAIKRSSAAVHFRLADDSDYAEVVAGKITASKAFIETVVALADGATPALDASLGNIFYLDAVGNRTIAVPSNATNGQKIVIRHFANGAARTLALNTGAGGFRFGTDITALTETGSGLMDYIGCIYNGVDSFWDVVAYTKGF